MKTYNFPLKNFSFQDAHPRRAGVPKGGVAPTSLVKPLRVIQTNSSPRRLRSPHFYLARSLLGQIVDLGQKMDLSPVVREFDLWRESYISKYVHLCKPQEDLHLFIKQCSRFDEDYVVPLRKKLKRLDRILWDLKIELTIDPKKFISLYDEFPFINKAWNKLRSWIRRRYGDFEFFRILEVTRAGRPHLHILISGIRWIPQKELSEIWSKYGGGKVVYIKRVWNQSNLKACNYVMKYVKKSLNEKNKVYSALLFATNARLFGISRGCQSLIRGQKTSGIKIKKGFRFLGSVFTIDLSEFCEKKGIRMTSFMLIKVSPRDYWEFPSIFLDDVTNFV